MLDTRNDSALPGTEPVTVEGVIDRIVFESADSGFFVGRMHESGTNELITFVGTVMAVSPGETIRLRGHWVNDKKFGRQLRTESWETLRPTSIDGIERYLGSGLIKGIGPTYAKRLIAKFGADTLTIIDEYPERVLEVEGIGRKRAEQIRQAWAEQKSVRSIMVFLQGHGISTGQAAKIYKRYGDSAVAVLRENPYKLAEDIAGIGFAGADKVAESLGVEKTSPRRLQAGIIFALQDASGDGHVCMPEDRLIAAAADLLCIDPKLLPDALTSLESQRQIVRQRGDCFLAPLHAAEAGCAQHIKRLLAAEKTPVSIDIEKALAWIESKQSIKLSEEQGDALRTAVNARMLVITGGPGTGKTTLVKGLISMFEAKGLSVLLAAPTGRAAKRMEAATGRASSTIHRLLEFSPRTGGFVRTEYDPLQTDMVVIDESSMVDVYLLHALLRALPGDCRAVFVGDVDQLPSVGPGNVLMDIIASNAVPTVRLRTVFRQAAESGIIRNAHRINRGENPEFNADDFFFVERPEAERAVGTVVELVTSRIPRKFGLDPMRDVQVLSPMHRGPVGVANLNQALQAALNANGTATSRRGLRIGDRVIQQRNNYDLDVFNGDMGRVEAVDEDTQTLTVNFDGRPVLYAFDQVDDLNLAYAITVHKSQGSEYPAVVMPLVSQHFMLLQRNVLYTGVTRAKKVVVIVGDPKALRRALHNTEVTRRHTRLAERLRNEI